MEVLDYCYGRGLCVYLHMTDIMKQNNPNAIQALIIKLYLISTIRFAYVYTSTTYMKAWQSSLV